MQVKRILPVFYLEVIQNGSLAHCDVFLRINLHFNKHHSLFLELSYCDIQLLKCLFVFCLC